MSKKSAVIDGNEAVAYVAYRTNEVIALYPITPSSSMGEWADAWASQGKLNLWGAVPSICEMQSEGGAAGAIHGALQTGALATTFTSSQGLLLMIPNMYKIAGELTPTVFHVAARTLATHALSIFGDHSDAMAVRQTGWALLASVSVQETMDMALIAQAASLESRLPYLHFFDGFRTSHEVAKIELLAEDDMRAMLDESLIEKHRARALSPDHPVLRGTAQNPDVFFQARETINPFYAVTADITQKVMDKFAKVVGRTYHLFDYYGAPDAERVIVLMGSGCETVHETVNALTAKGQKVGVLKVRLYRPFDVKRFVKALPVSVRSIAVLDRTKEPGSTGEPLYLDCVAAIQEGISEGWAPWKKSPTIIGGRYGLSSKEFTASMVNAVFDNLAAPTPKTHFTVGIADDVSHSSLDYDPAFSIEPDSTVRALFYGLGSDGTVGATRNTIKIIGEETDNYAQGYFVYDSKKSGAMTVSHARFGPTPIQSTYLISRANFVGCHQPVFLDSYDILRDIAPGGTFLLNTPFGPDQVWKHLPRIAQEHLIQKRLKFYVIDAYKVAGECKIGNRINTIMQVCFFAISGVLPKDKAIAAIKDSIKKTYGKKGDEVVQQNLCAVDSALAQMFEVKIPASVESTRELKPPVSVNAPEFVRDVLGCIIAGRGDELPVSKFPVDGTFPTATSQYEKRNIAMEIPVWDPAVCIQCARCSFICPNAAIRLKVYDPKYLTNAPATFKSKDAIDKDWKGLKVTVQVTPEDCTGCQVCAQICPGRDRVDKTHKALTMTPQPPLLEQEKKNWEFFQTIPLYNRRDLKMTGIRQQQMEQPLFEFAGSCAGCGETPYLKLVSQLFGDRMIAANATGCSSIYGGNLPTTPWSKNAEGRGPSWSNSLFEDNAEFGLGFRLTIDQQRGFAGTLLKKLSAVVGENLVQSILTTDQKDEAGIYDQRQRVEELKKILVKQTTPEAKMLLGIADMLVKKSVWIIGGDGWAYDIGYGGLDHVLASGRNVNVLVLDSEVYSNTGGQMSKATPLGAVAKFAAGGKRMPKKDLGLIAMSYGNIYVASVAMGAREEQALKAFLEAEAYDGPSLVICYSPCIAHGIDMSFNVQHQKAAVDSGHWILYRFNPERAARGESPLQLDSPTPKLPVAEFLNIENRFRMLTKSKPEDAKILAAEAQRDVESRRRLYEYLAAWKPAATEKSATTEATAAPA